MSRCRHDAFHDCRFPLQLPLRPQQEFDIATTVAPPTWTVKDAEKLYNMNGWGLGYFRINPDGHVTVHPDANRKRGLDLYHLATDLHAQGVGLPLLLRFSDILRVADRGPLGRVRQRDQGVRVRGELHHRLPDQGQPAAPRGGGDRGVRRAATALASSAAASPSSRRCWASTRQHPTSHRLQRLQGRGVHAAGPDGPEARPHGDGRARAAQRARRPAQGGRRDGRGSRPRASASSWRPRARAAGPRAAARGRKFGLSARS